MTSSHGAVKNHTVRTHQAKPLPCHPREQSMDVMLLSLHDLFHFFLYSEKVRATFTCCLHHSLEWLPVVGRCHSNRLNVDSCYRGIQEEHQIHLVPEQDGNLVMVENLIPWTKMRSGGEGIRRLRTNAFFQSISNPVSRHLLSFSLRH